LHSRLRVPCLALGLLIVPFLGGRVAHAQLAHLVKDLNTTQTRSLGSPSTPAPVSIGTAMFFAGDDGGTGLELWKLDTATGVASLVKDICPGSCPSLPDRFSALGGQLYFLANDGVHGNELWRSDGTEAGTVLVKDIQPGESGSVFSEIVAAGGTLFFFAADSVHGRSLWASDGTAAGTHWVADVGTGFPRILAAAGSKVLLLGGDVDHGFEPWISDGTAAGTGLIRDLLPGTASSIDWVYPANFPIPALGLPDGTFLFAANDGVHGYELWHTDGTDAGTSQVADINPGSSNSNPHGFVSFGGKIYFNATTAADGPELWVTDGTAAGTARVKDPSGGGGVSNPDLLTVANGLLFFRAGNGNLWKSDGTGPGTVQVSSSVSPDAIGTLGGSLVLIAGNTEADPVELWTSDGTSGGTVLVKQLNPESAACLFRQSLTEAAGASYFYFCPYQNQALWKTDGTAAGTVAVQSPTRTPSFPVLSWRGHDTFLTPAPGGRLLFDADNGNNAWVWRTDGTAAGTHQAVGIPFLGHWPSLTFPFFNNPILLGSSWLYGDGELWSIDPIGGGVTTLLYTGVQSFGFQPLGGLVLFQRYDAQEFTYQLWKTDGTSPGTALVWDSTFSSLGTLGSQLLLLSLGSDAVWKTDGTPAGTVLVQGGLTQARGGVAAGSFLYFTSQQDFSHYFLWKTDGTAAGTSTVATLPGYPYLSGLPPAPAVAFGSLLFFQLDDGVHGLELWVTDGTDAGTHLVKDIWPGSQGAAIGPYFAVFQGRLLFLADDGVHGQELWSTDGTDAGTSMVKDIRPGAEPSTIGWGLVPAGNRVYFTADDGVHGQELWITDGTGAGTHLVKDVLPGPETSSPSQLTPMGSRLVFTANDGAHGAEPWSTNGTAVGTFLYQDIAPGARSSGAQSYTASPPLVYFIADDGTTGTELWSTPKALLESSFTDVPSDYWAWRFIESLFASGVTSGCGVRQFCPGDYVNRAQMAVFVLAARGTAPPPATGTRFADVPLGYWAGPWIEELAREGVVSGCAANLYCPNNLLTRAEMAVLLTVSRHETPPPATGTRFADVPADYWAARFIEQLAADGITSGCGGGNYCPDQPITRGEMAVFLPTAFHLPLP
jgi:ELWxxDGT repeat protein